MANEVQDPAPTHSQGYGAAEHADDTRQAQHGVVNDAPTDVNANAAVARLQVSTYALMQANFEAAAARMNNIFNILSATIAAKAAA